MKVLLVGDTHGSRKAIATAFSVATELSCDLIFQLGDFGFDPRSRSGNSYLTWVNDVIKSQGVPFYWLAGNHEDWNDLDYIFATYLTDDDGFHLYGNMRLAPRSNVWTWDGIVFANMSGAFSIDKDQRIENISWFPQELPTHQDIDFLQERMGIKGLSEIDVLLSHDAPVNLYAHKGLHKMVFRHPDAEMAQTVMSRAVNELKPHVLIHGHWHMYYTYYHHNTLCVGLNEMTTNRYTIQMAVLDTQRRTLASVTSQEDVIFEIP